MAHRYEQRMTGCDGECIPQSEHQRSAIEDTLGLGSRTGRARYSPHCTLRSGVECTDVEVPG